MCVCVFALCSNVLYIYERKVVGKKVGWVAGELEVLEFDLQKVLTGLFWGIRIGNLIRGLEF